MIIPGPSIHNSPQSTFGSNFTVPIANTIASTAKYSADPFTYVNGGVGYTNSYVDVAGGGYQNTSYFKDAFGVVYLAVGAKSGTNATSIFTLPAGYRPARSVMVQAYIDGGGINWFGVHPDGTVIPLTGGNTQVVGYATFLAAL